MFYYLAEKKVRIAITAKKTSIQNKDFVLRSTSTDENTIKDVADGNASSGNRLSSSSFNQPQSQKLPETKGNNTLNLLLVSIIFIFILYRKL